MNQNNSKTARLNGLVLAGGKSTRLGKNKSLIRWHGKEQIYHVADLLQPFCTDVFISCRKDQQQSILPGYATITDRYEDMGPYGAILSAFDFDPKASWLVVACDLPLLDSTTISMLLTQRDPNAIATAFQSPEDGLPEPLVAVWEPKSFPILLSFSSNGHQSPRKLLIDNSAKIIAANNSIALCNVNTPEDEQNAKRLMG